jgi:lipoprotein signal peptidase
MNRRRWLLCALLLAVVAADQGGKWWAWRHVPDAQLNFGSGPLLDDRLGQWFADPGPGALLDLVGAYLLSGITLAVVCRRSSPVLSVLGVLAVAGWDSNLLDRLGLHYVTAPGSRRGVVDFISLGPNVYNLADFVIVSGTVLLVAAAVAVRLHSHYFAQGVVKTGQEAATSPK